MEKVSAYKDSLGKYHDTAEKAIIEDTRQELFLFVQKYVEYSTEWSLGDGKRERKYASNMIDGMIEHFDRIKTIINDHEVALNEANEEDDEDACPQSTDHRRFIFAHNYSRQLGVNYTVQDSHNGRTVATFDIAEAAKEACMILNRGEWHV